MKIRDEHGNYLRDLSNETQNNLLFESNNFCAVVDVLFLINNGTPIDDGGHDMKFVKEVSGFEKPRTWKKGNRWTYKNNILYAPDGTAAGTIAASLAYEIVTKLNGEEP